MHRTSVQNLNSSFTWSNTGDMSLNHSLNGSLNMASQVSTPIPKPRFILERQTFSTKKAKGETPIERRPPKPPVKSAPPVSRIFAHRESHKPQAVSFKCSDASLTSQFYDEGIRDLYFDQCFQIEGKLGAGSFGEVFKVRSKEDGKLYAVKRSRERFRGECDRRRKLEEVAKHEKLPKHPNCVQFIRAWEERKHLYMQTELCKTSLNVLAEQNHNFPETLIWKYLVDLLMAVKHLHDNELIHMDIKPENIFITDQMTCKLGDFGLVIDISKGDQQEYQEGDPRYLSPELMVGSFGKPADVFSLGITILELASDLDLPRGGDLWHELRSRHLPEEFLSGISEELKTVIRWMMDPDPVSRPTADEVLNSGFLKQIWRQRRQEQWVQTMWGRMNAALLVMYNLLVTMFLAITYPLHSALHIHHNMSPLRLPPTPTINPSELEMDRSFSDDDSFDDEINISNNSMGVPLNFSSSSEDSIAQDLFGFKNFAKREVKTTPGLRHKPRIHTPPASGSPILHGLGSRYSSSPLTSPFRKELSHISQNRSLSGTPNHSFLNKSLQEEELLPGKINLEPKNLLEVFKNASFDEDYRT